MLAVEKPLTICMGNTGGESVREAPLQLLSSSYLNSPGSPSSPQHTCLSLDLWKGKPRTKVLGIAQSPLPSCTR